MIKKMFALMALAAITATPSMAANIVADGSFETPSVPSQTQLYTGNGGTITVGAWTLGGNSTDPDGFGNLINQCKSGDSHWSDRLGMKVINADEGAQYINMRRLGNSSGACAMYQTVSTIPGKTYKITFALASSFEGMSAAPVVRVQFGALNDLVTGTQAMGNTWWQTITRYATASSTSTEIRLTRGLDVPIMIDNVIIEESDYVPPTGELVADGGFELPDVSSQPDGVTFAGWNSIGTLLGNAWLIGGYGTDPDGYQGFTSVMKTNTANWGALWAPEGMQCVYMSSYANQSFPKLSQTLATTPGVEYKLRFAIDAFRYETGAAQVRVIFGSLDETFTSAAPNPDPYASGWQVIERYVTATSSSTELSFQRVAGGGLLLDYVSVRDKNDVPSEPSITYSDDITVDGNLADWADADWKDETFAYYPIPNVNSDMTNPQVAWKWGAAGTKLYMAARVQDSFHYFTNTYSDWDDSDRIEAQIWASSQSGAINVGLEDIAQQYELGLKSNGIDTWSGMGGGASIPASANLQYSVKTGADGWIYYEAAMTPFELFNRLTGETTPKVLAVDDTIGADACIASINGSGQYNQVAINALGGKYANTNSIAKWKLVRTGVQGSIDLLNYNADVFGQAGTVTITDGVSTETHKIVLDTNGLFTFTTALTGDCTVKAKVGHWLAKSEAVTVDVDGNGTVNFSLINGDINDDNIVDSVDYAILSANWEMEPPTNENADLNGDGIVDSVDYAILSANWELEGE